MAAIPISGTFYYFSHERAMREGIPIKVCDFGGKDMTRGWTRTPGNNKNDRNSTCANFVKTTIFLSGSFPVSPPSSMTVDILKKRRIVVLGSRSVGQSIHLPFSRPFLCHRHLRPNTHLHRKVILGHQVHRQQLCRILLPDHRKHLLQVHQPQGHRI